VLGSGYWLLVTTDYRLLITDYLVTGYHRLPITDYRLPITDYRLPGCWFTPFGRELASLGSGIRLRVAGCWVLVTGYWLPPITDY
jgi:hypothetical protein